MYCTLSRVLLYAFIPVSELDLLQDNPWGDMIQDEVNIELELNVRRS